MAVGPRPREPGNPNFTVGRHEGRSFPQGRNPTGGRWGNKFRNGGFGPQGAKAKKMVLATSNRGVARGRNSGGSQVGGGGPGPSGGGQGRRGGKGGGSAGQGNGDKE
ncbi:hypothetical protein JTE90_021021 [Oedothorax gibbosus]|uniref:Uncharacterized protein n=1 Tax=Oedothorax gibbosus TaxID=931172 RepID=A0AAV6TEY3_9ARAC|nr:hypothetical protein JTE90_021021 [Oedothorax gibbosus]